MSAHHFLNRPPPKENCPGWDCKSVAQTRRRKHFSQAAPNKFLRLQSGTFLQVSAQRFLNRQVPNSDNQSGMAKVLLRRDAERISCMLVSADFCKFLRHVSASVCAAFSESPSTGKVFSRVGLRKCCSDATQKAISASWFLQLAALAFCVESAQHFCDLALGIVFSGESRADACRTTPNAMLGTVTHAVFVFPRAATFHLVGFCATLRVLRSNHVCPVAEICIWSGSASVCAFLQISANPGPARFSAF